MTLLPMPNTTARELLAHIAGDDHAMHSITGQKSPSRGKIEIICSCGEAFKVPVTTDCLRALRNVRPPEQKLRNKTHD
jgi:hypothetical protein